MSLRIVTDSTSDLSPALLQEFGIEMVPLSVHFGPESFRDVVEMGPEAFWAKLNSCPHHPKTAQPAPGDFLTVYKRLHEQGDEILSLHISGKLSGTIGSAQIAAQMVPDAKIRLLDTASVSMGLGLLAVGATRMAQEGASLETVHDWASQTAAKMQIFFTLDTLEFLQRNGRIGRAQALLGGLLGIKPILQVQDGLVGPADKVRGKSKVLPRTLELMQERVPAGRKIRLAVLHTQAPADAEKWLTEIQKLYDVVEHYTAHIGPVIGSHTGPGTLGVCFHEV